MTKGYDSVRLIIAGGRYYKKRPGDIGRLDAVAKELGVKKVLTGGATGADQMGKDWALSRDLEHEEYPAQWGAHGRSAGPIRNEKMASLADAVVLFPGGPGTASMFEKATVAGLLILDWR